MSVSGEGDQFPAMMPGEGGRLAAEMIVEDGRVPPAMLRAMQPPGAVFALGWVMAELFDPRRRVSAAVRQPPFDPGTQLPLVTDLAADPRLVYLAAELAEYLHWFPRLARPLRRVTAQTNKKRAAIAAENLATAETAEADDVVHAEAATAAVSAILGDGVPRRRDGTEPGHTRRVRR